MSYVHVATSNQLAELCEQLARVDEIAFDTEFVSEYTYRPQLCLVQVAAPGLLAVIDPFSCGSLERFWSALADTDHETIVHAGREEVNFSLTSIGRQPAKLFDVQIAAGLVGDEYPAGYAALLDRMLGQTMHKGETRTDWRKRPLSRQQLEYALDDVRYLSPLKQKLVERLAELGRLAWIQDEMVAFQQEIEAGRNRERWRRVSGLSGFSPRSLAVAREIWRWRESEAERRDVPARQVLRDDLLVELAKRRATDPKHVRAVRGMDRRELQPFIATIAEHIRRAQELPAADLPQNVRRDIPSQVNVLGQFLSTALTSLCRSLKIAPSIVGTASDVRDLIAFRLKMIDGPPPLLATGWRAEIVGSLIDDLLSGTTSIRIADPLSDHPLIFEKLHANHN
jgi:ribonuclease D